MQKCRGSVRHTCPQTPGRAVLVRDLGLSFDGTLAGYSDLLGVKTELSLISQTVL